MPAGEQEHTYKELLGIKAYINYVTFKAKKEDYGFKFLTYAFHYRLW